MDKPKFNAYFITGAREHSEAEPELIAARQPEHPLETTIKKESLLWLESSRVPGATMYMECFWLWNGKTSMGQMEEPHLHGFDEVIGFIGSDPDNPRDLDAVIELSLDDEVHSLTKSSLVFIPAGLKHGTLIFKEVNRPVFFFTLAPVGQYSRTSLDASRQNSFIPPEPDGSGTRYGRYIITKPKAHAPDPNKKEGPKTANATQVVSLDSEVAPGAFYVDFCWIWSGSMTMAPEPHKHNFDEIIGFAASGSKDNPRPIGGQVSIHIEQEEYPVTQSTIVYLPPNVEHCPLEFKDISRPVLCFTIGNTAIYNSEKTGTADKQEIASEK